jgi:hypothetical protein
MLSNAAKIMKYAAEKDLSQIDAAVIAEGMKDVSLATPSDFTEGIDEAV